MLLTVLWTLVLYISDGQSNKILFANQSLPWILNVQTYPLLFSLQTKFNIVIHNVSPIMVSFIIKQLTFAYSNQIFHTDSISQIYQLLYSTIFGCCREPSSRIGRNKSSFYLFGLAKLRLAVLCHRNK